MSLEPVQLVGGTGSPYTQKMVALLRYRRIPYAITWGQPEVLCAALGVEAPKPTFMPTFFFDDGGKLTAHCDSTPIIRRLEADHIGRSVLPKDPALAFIDYLIEDFADEWCTKYMFHYRWHFAADADNAGTKLPLSMDVSMPQEADWVAVEDQPASLSGLLEEIGRVYSPAQLANAQAVMAQNKTWECEIDGARWHQRTFPYQAKCLQWTRDQYRQLSPADQARVDAVIAGTGIELMLEGAA